MYNHIGISSYFIRRKRRSDKIALCCSAFSLVLLCVAVVLTLTLL